MKINTMVKLGMITMIGLNIVLISLFVFSPKGRNSMAKPVSGKSMNMMERIGQKLQLDEAQKKAYKKSATQHRKDMNDVTLNQKELVKRYFETLTDEIELEKKDGLLREIQALEVKKITITYDHFKELRDQCREDQLENFEEIMSDVTRVLSSGRGRQGPPRKKF